MHHIHLKVLVRVCTPSLTASGFPMKSHMTIFSRRSYHSVPAGILASQWPHPTLPSSRWLNVSGAARHQGQQPLPPRWSGGARVVFAFDEDSRSVVLVVGSSVVVVSSVSVVCCIVESESDRNRTASARLLAGNRYRTSRAKPSEVRRGRRIRHRSRHKSHISSALFFRVGHHPGPRSLCFARGLGFIDAE